MLFQVLLQALLAGLVPVCRVLERVRDFCVDIVCSFHDFHGVLCHDELLVCRDDEDLHFRVVGGDACLGVSCVGSLVLFRVDFDSEVLKSFERLSADEG